MNFLKLLVLLKSNLKLQIYKHVIAEQNIVNSRAEFPMKIYHSVYLSKFIIHPETVSRNLPVPRNLPNRHKKCMWPKSQKKPNYIWPFFKNKKKPKELKKSQKLQIWPQKSQTGNPASYRNWKWTREDSLPCCHYAIPTAEQIACKVRNLPLQTGKAAAMSELQTHPCTTPGQWTLFLCTVGIIPANELTMQELNQSQRNWVPG